MITEIEQRTSDIDWFFTNDEYIAFVASGGGKLPLSVSKSKESIEKLSNYFRGLPIKCEAVINPELNKIIPTFDKNYLSECVLMAERGLFAYDKSILNNFEDTKYHLVAQPSNPMKINELPETIVNILKKTEVYGPMKKNLIITDF